MSPRSRVITAVVAVLLLAAGVAGVWAVQASSDGDGNDKAKVAASSSTTTTAAASQPPAIVNQGEDWDAIMRSLVGYLSWVHQHPDPALLEQYAVPSCPCYDGLTAKLRGYVEKGQHVVGAGDEVVSVRLSSVVLRWPDGRPKVVGLYVVNQKRPLELVDRNGTVVERSAGSGPCGLLVDLIDSGDARWRVSKVDRLTVPGTNEPCP